WSLDLAAGQSRQGSVRAALLWPDRLRSTVLALGGSDLDISVSTLVSDSLAGLARACPNVDSRTSWRTHTTKNRRSRRSLASTSLALTTRVLKVRLLLALPPCSALHPGRQERTTMAFPMSLPSSC